ncbi:MAG: hypothetical protein RPT25_08895 [Cycloclasticus sp.]|jgi:hypothetical protein
MSGINQFLKESLVETIAGIHLVPNIPEKKINNAIGSFKFNGNINSIIALYDSTVFGSGKDGMLFTGEKIINKEAFQDPTEIPYQSIRDVEHKIEVEKKDNGKEKKSESIVIEYGATDSLEIKHIQNCSYEKLVEVLSSAAKDFDEYKEEDQMLTISSLSEELKIAYLKIMINMTIADDGIVDEEELAEILQLMTRLDLTIESRYQVREYITNAVEGITLSELMTVINSECPNSQLKATHISLVKDLISIYKSVKDAPLSDFSFFHDNRSAFDISDEEIELAIMAIDNDRKLLNKEYNDGDIEKSIKELSSKAVSVGVPLGAVYLSGSVIGMSAAGMTSGLATLGFGGVLGLSSMATGIGVAVLLGVGAYKGMKHFTGANELEGNKRRELMLQDVIKQTQCTISMMMEDINYLVGRLNEIMVSDGISKEKIQKLAQMVSLFSKAGKNLTHKSDEAQSDVQRLKCPKFLDMEKLESLTQEPTKKPLLELIKKFYSKSEETEERDGKEVKVTKFRLHDDVSNRELENVSKAFEAIGYFDVSKVVVGAVTSKLKGMFA